MPCRPLAAALVLGLAAFAGCAEAAPRAAGPVRVEAEDCPTTGERSAASTAVHTPEAEASGRRCVALPPGARLDFAVPVAADSIVVRASYPDAPAGGGADGSVSLLIAGTAHALPLTSRCSWDYGRGRFNSPDVWWSDPAQGQPRHFWDEAALRFPAVAAGSVITLVNPGPQAVRIDFAEFELVPPAVPAPPDSLSFADWHPDAGGAADATALLQAALAEAQRQGRPLHVPEGTYRIDAVDMPGGRLQGAGMWRTRFIGARSRFRFTGGTAVVADLAILGATSVRNDHSDDDNAFSGVPGPGSRLERVWVEHKKCAYWVAPAGGRTVSGLTIAGCRFRDLMADGVNLYDGARDCVIEDCQVRNSGDDGLASWSPAGRGQPSGGIIIRRNRVESPWLASGIALYGGGPFTVADNTVVDTVTTGSGIFVSASFGAWPFAGRVEVAGNRLVRCGAHESGPGGPTGAIRLLALDADMTAATFALRGNRVVAPLESAVSVQGPRAIANLEVADLVAEELGAACLVDIRPGAVGSGIFSAVSAPGVPEPRWRIPAGSGFAVTRRERP